MSYPKRPVVSFKIDSVLTPGELAAVAKALATWAENLGLPREFEPAFTYPLPSIRMGVRTIYVSYSPEATRSELISEQVTGVIEAALLRRHVWGYLVLCTTQVLVSFRWSPWLPKVNAIEHDETAEVEALP